MINFGQEFKINKGDKITIGNELTLEFLYHSHKTVYPNQVSPLIISLAITNAQGIREEVNINLFPEESKVWTWSQYRFELGDYEYDKYMDLTIFKVLNTS